MPIVTTYLEMTSRDQLVPKRCDDPRFRVLQATVPQGQLNRFLYILVGQPWSWTDRLKWSDAEWEAYAAQTAVRTFVGYWEGSPAGYFELRGTDEIEIAYFGLAPKFIGRGLGGPLLTAALEHAWSCQPRRVWVHTCTADHPAALQNYEARGLRIYRTEAA